MKDNTINYSSKNHNHYPYFLHVFPPLLVSFSFFLLVSACLMQALKKTKQKKKTRQWPGELHLDALHSLFDVLQQGFVLRALVLVLMRVHICQSAHVTVKILLVHRLLWNRLESMKANEGRRFWGVCGLTNKRRGSDTS